MELIDKGDLNTIQPTLHSSEEATTDEMRSIEHYWQLRNIYIILHQGQTPKPHRAQPKSWLSRPLNPQGSRSLSSAPNGVYRARRGLTLQTKPELKPQDRSSEARRPSGKNQSRNRRVDQTRQEVHGDQTRRDCKKTLNTAFISDPIISSKHLTIAAESYHERAEPNQTS